MSRTFLDTSILIQGLLEFGPEVHAAQEVMDRIAKRTLLRPVTAWHCCLEFFAVTTRLPEEFRLSPDQALELLEAEVFAHFEVHELPKRQRVTFLRRAAAERAAGGRIYDAHIAAIARGSGSKTVITENVRHFAVLEQDNIRVIRAAEFVAQSFSLPRGRPG